MFAETHRLALALVGEGLVDGLRVDHPDGLADPAGYLERLRDGGAGHVWVEKIVDPGEQLREWPVEGTTGYEFLNDVAALFVDPAGEAPLTALWAELAGDPRPFGEWAAEAKLEQARTTFAPTSMAAPDWPAVEGLEPALAALPVYRTYIRDGVVAPEDRHVLGEAGLEAWLAPAPAAFVTRFQQTTPPIMAKGVEDTAFYRYVRLLALCDVGGDPGRWIARRRRLPRRQRRARRPLPAPPARLPDARHEAVGRRAGADRRAGRDRGGVGRSGAPLARAGRAVTGGRGARRGRGADDLPDARGRLADRARPVVRYMEKALREAKRNSRWVEPDAGWEARVLGYCRALYDHAPFRAAFEPFAERVAIIGELHALRQTALKLTAPGVPDIYQGDELVALSLVDPDNRRPVDWERRRRAARGAAGRQGAGQPRRAQAVPHSRAARPARAPAGRVRGGLHAARRRPGRRSRSSAATPWPWRCPSARAGSTPTCSRCPPATGARCSTRSRSPAPRSRCSSGAERVPCRVVAAPRDGVVLAPGTRDQLVQPRRRGVVGRLYPQRPATAAACRGCRSRASRARRTASAASAGSARR